jgi:hypothetical protein
VKKNIQKRKVPLNITLIIPAGASKVGGTVRGTILATYRILRMTFRYAIGGIAQQRRLRT